MRKWVTNCAKLRDVIYGRTLNILLRSKGGLPHAVSNMCLLHGITFYINSLVCCFLISFFIITKSNVVALFWQWHIWTSNIWNSAWTNVITLMKMWHFSVKASWISTLQQTVPCWKKFTQALKAASLLVQKWVFKTSELILQLNYLQKSKA